MKLKLPMLLTPKVTLSRWGAEIRGLNFLLDEDFSAEAWRDDWEPEVSSSMTLTDVQIFQSRYLQVGKMVWFKISVRFTTGGVASASVTFKVPRIIGSTGGETFAAAIRDGGNRGGVAFTQAGTDDTMVVIKADGANWGLGASRSFAVNGSYQAM